MTTTKIIDIDGKTRTIKEYIRKRITTLKQMCIWDKLSFDDQINFRSCTDDTQVDNLMGEFRRKYL